jgi:hypothetical protein
MWKQVFLKLGIVVLVVAVAGGGVVTLRWLASEPLETAETVNLEDEWANTIRKIGIEPVFPPEEDLTVGDVLAVVVKDNKPDAETDDAKITAQTPLPKRAIKLAHVDVRKALTDSYRLLPVFIAPPSTLLPPVKPTAADNAPAAQEAADDKTPATKQAAEVKVTLPAVVRNFLAETNQGDLPRAAFPKLKIQGSSNASGGLGASLGGFFGYGTDNRGLEELFLTEVRTYGLPSADAADLLKAFCTAEKTKHACSDIMARQHLERVVGDNKEGKPRVHQKYVSDKKGNQRYRIRIDIVMVNRVYLARAIRNLNQSGSAEGGRLSVTVQPGTQPAVGGSAQGSPPATANADRADIEAIRKRLEEIEKQSSGSTGGSAVYGRSQDREALLNESFDRPVAIGYRSVRLMPGDDEAE